MAGNRAPRRPLQLVQLVHMRRRGRLQDRRGRRDGQRLVGHPSPACQSLGNDGATAARLWPKDQPAPDRANVVLLLTLLRVVLLPAPLRSLGLLLASLAWCVCGWCARTRSSIDPQAHDVRFEPALRTHIPVHPISVPMPPFRKPLHTRTVRRRHLLKSSSTFLVLLLLVPQRPAHAMLPPSPARRFCLIELGAC